MCLFIHQKDHIYICVYLCICISINIYICIERERAKHIFAYSKSPIFIIFTLLYVFVQYVHIYWAHTHSPPLPTHTDLRMSKGGLPLVILQGNFVDFRIVSLGHGRFCRLHWLGARGKGRGRPFFCSKVNFGQRLPAWQVGAVLQYQVHTLKGSPSSHTFSAISLEPWLYTYISIYLYI